MSVLAVAGWAVASQAGNVPGGAGNVLVVVPTSSVAAVTKAAPAAGTRAPVQPSVANPSLAANPMAMMSAPPAQKAPAGGSAKGPVMDFGLAPGHDQTPAWQRYLERAGYLVLGIVGGLWAARRVLKRMKEDRS